MFSDSKAIIDNVDGLYTVSTNDGEVIAASHDMERISERINYAERNADVRISHDGKEMTLEEYTVSNSPIIYRFTYGISEVSGFIGVLDYIKKGRYSKIQIFDNPEDMKQFIIDKQKDDDYFFIWGQGRYSLEMVGLGLDYYQLSKKQLDTSRISKELAAERAKRNNGLAANDNGNKKDKENSFDVNQLYA